MKAWTDYPFTFLGDVPYQKAPIRECEVLGWDGDRYCRILVDDKFADVKAGYLYQKPGRCTEVPSIDTSLIPILTE